MRASILTVVLASALVLLAAPGLVAQQGPEGQAKKLEIAFDLGGHVTLVAENVTLREILAEWGRIGGAYMVNAERLTGAPIRMMRFENRPELEVLGSLLRPAAGYIVSPRTVRTSGPSRFEVVMILPTSTPAGSSSSPSAATSATPFRTPGAPEDEIPPVVPAVGIPPPGQSMQPATPQSPTGSPGPGVYVPIVPVTPVTPATGGRGRGGGGS
jgi:hypothetical protein